MNTKQQQSNYTHFELPRKEEDGWRDLFNGGEAGVLPSVPGVLQGAEGGGDGAAAHGAVPAPRERGDSSVPEPPRHGDRGHVRAAPHGQIHLALLARERCRHWPDVRALRRAQHPPPR